MQIARRLHPMVTRRIGHHRITFTVRDHFIGPTLYLDRAWEPYLLQLLPAYDLAGKVAIDVGACFGTYTLALSDLVGVSGRVISVEPGPEQLRFLERNVAQNGIENVTIVRAALAGTSSNARFDRDPLNIGCGRLVDGDGTEVQVVTLDSLTAAIPAGTVGFVKIDVEGQELQVLEGMSETLRRNPDVILQVEVNPSWNGGSPREFVTALGALGLDGWEIHRQRILPMQEPRHYEWPLFREPTDLVISRDAEDLGRRLRERIRWPAADSEGPVG
jgi:FkbM family methyltransferase